MAKHDSSEPLAKPSGNYWKRLQQKWGLKSVLQLVIVLIIFALGGSTCAYLGRLIMKELQISSSVLSTVVYIVLVTMLWPCCVLLISIPFGQFTFFKQYIAKLGRRMVGKK